MAEKTGKEKLFEAALNLAKPEVEKLVERNLIPLLDVPLLRELFNVSPKLMVSLMSLGIGMIPESMKRSPMGGFLIDMAETLPREIGRLLEISDASSQPDPATAVKEAAKTTGKYGGTKKTIAPPHATPSQKHPILAVIDEKMFGEINPFLHWFRKLSRKDKKKAEKYILSLTPDQVKIFMQVTPKNRMALIQRLQKVEPDVEEIDIPGFVSIFAGQIAKRMRAKTSKKVKRYGPLSRFAYAFSGNPIDEQGRRKR